MLGDLLDASAALGAGLTVTRRSVQHLSDARGHTDDDADTSQYQHAHNGHAIDDDTGTNNSTTGKVARRIVQGRTQGQEQ